MNGLKLFYIFGLGILSCPNVQAAPKATYASFDQMLNLKHGDECSWEAEELRLNFSMTYMELIGLNKKMEAMLAFVDFKDKLMALGQPICDASQLNVCNKNTGKCDCGEPGSVLILGDKSSSSFVTEQDESSNTTVCHYAIDQYCIPQNFTVKPPSTSSSSSTEFLKCATGSVCVSRETKKTCSFIDFLMEALRTLRDDQSNVGHALLKQLVEGKVCYCQMDPGTDDNKLSEDEDQVDTKGNSIKQPHASIMKRDVLSNDNERNIQSLSVLGSLPSLDLIM